MEKNQEVVDIKSDFSADESMARFHAALGGAMKVSKSKLNRLLLEDRITPLASQRRGRRPRYLASAPASLGRD